MPRKSSFLSGFEVGSALYSRGYQQATQRRQMQLGEDRDKRLEAQQKLEFGLRQGVAEQAKKKFEAENKERVRIATNRDEGNALVADLMERIKPFDSDTAEGYEFILKEIHGARSKIKDKNVGARLDAYKSGLSTLKGARLKRQTELEEDVRSAATIENNIKDKQAFGKELKTWNFGTGMNIPQTPEGRAMMMHLKPLFKRAEVFAKAGELNMEGLEDLPADAQAKLESRLKDTIEIRTIGLEQAEKIRVKKVGEAQTAAEKAGQLKNEIELSLTIAKLALEGKSGGLPDEDRKVVIASGVKLRGEPAVRTSQSASGQLDQMVKIINAGRGSASDDLAMIFMFMKSLDPGSVVREGEFATAQNAAGVPERIRNSYNHLFEGTRLSENQRKEFLATATNAVDGLRAKAHQVIKSYTAELNKFNITDTFSEMHELIGFSTHTFNSEEEFQNADREGWMPGDKFKYKDGAGNWRGGDVQGPEEGDPTGWTPEDENDFRADKARLALQSPTIRNQKSKVVGERISLGNISNKWKWHGTVNAAAARTAAEAAASGDDSAEGGAVFEIVEAGRNGFKIKDAATGKLFYLPDNMIIQGGP